MTILMNGAYFNGLDQPSNLQTALAQIPGSRTTDYILFSLNVASSSSADINFGLTGPVLASGGQSQPAVADLLTSVVSAGTSKGNCKRVWLSIGGWGSPAFANIQSIVQGGGSLETTLLDNFNAIVAAIQAVSGVESVGFDLDYEEDVESLATLVSGVTIALYKKFNCSFTFCPYQGLTNQNKSSPWIDALQAVYAELGVQPVVGFNLQTYAGGTGNNPSDWTSAVASASKTGVATPDSFIWPIVSCDTTATPDSTPSQVTTSMTGWKSQGASLWATAALPYQTYTLSNYASAIAAG